MKNWIAVASADHARRGRDATAAASGQAPADLRLIAQAMQADSHLLHF